ncbi:WASH complex subunit 1 [Frankliniella fusca]|uniref:WASH complex subunit 1 n=1 Tax=Frankliniella fusca TaxID=407009 RepID=A0AAE1LMM9_9NEOP|nr:WASH complex subunit 1 [Frankliniella fusca]
MGEFSSFWFLLLSSIRLNGGGSERQGAAAGVVVVAVGAVPTLPLPLPLGGVPGFARRLARLADLAGVSPGPGAPEGPPALARARGPRRRASPESGRAGGGGVQVERRQVRVCDAGRGGHLGPEDADMQAAPAAADRVVVAEGAEGRRVAVAAVVEVAAQELVIGVNEARVVETAIGVSNETRAKARVPVTAQRKCSFAVFLACFPALPSYDSVLQPADSSLDASNPRGEPFESGGNTDNPAGTELNGRDPLDRKSKAVGLSGHLLGTHWRQRMRTTARMAPSSSTPALQETSTRNHVSSSAPTPMPPICRGSSTYSTPGAPARPPLQSHTNVLGVRALKRACETQRELLLNIDESSEPVCLFVIPGVSAKMAGGAVSSSALDIDMQYRVKLGTCSRLGWCDALAASRTGITAWLKDTCAVKYFLSSTEAQQSCGQFFLGLPFPKA